MPYKYWREAATLMIIGRNNILSSGNIHRQKLNSLETNYELLFLKRSSKSTFMPNIYVFPGGAMDTADVSTHWLSLFKVHGYTKDDLYSMFRFESKRPCIYSNKPSDQLLPELAFRICALRETFEETGLLLSASNASDVVEPFKFESIAEREDWRLKIRNDAEQFISLYYHIGKLPNVWNLHEWMTWLTPAFFIGKKRRFDTVFYTTFLDSEIPTTLTCCAGEADELQIEKPYEVIQAHYARKIVLGPPQLTELGRLLNFSDFYKVKKFSEERRWKGMSRWLPVKVAATDGHLTVHPGDDLYPHSPDYFGTSNDEELVLPHSIEESRKFCSNLNRCEFTKSKATHYVTNVLPEFGHAMPLLLDEWNPSASK